MYMADHVKQQRRTEKEIPKKDAGNQNIVSVDNSDKWHQNIHPAMSRYHSL